MRIIITGGTGLIGRALAESLAADEHEVILLSRDPRRVAAPPRVQVTAWDGVSANGWGSLADGAGAIINLAGESIAGDSLLSIRWTPERKQRILHSRQSAGAAVVEAVRTAQPKPKVILQVSAVGYYGPRVDSQVDESAPPGTDFLAQVCQVWEASTQMVETVGVRRVVTRIGIVLSAGGGALPRQLLPFRLFAGGPIGSGKQGYPWIHLADVVGAMRFLIENPAESGVYNLCAPDPLTNAAFGRAAARVMRRPYWIPVPAVVFRLAFGEAATILLDGQMAYPKRLLEAGYVFCFPQAGEALKDILTPRR